MTFKQLKLLCFKIATFVKTTQKECYNADKYAEQLFLKHNKKNDMSYSNL